VFFEGSKLQGDIQFWFYLNPIAHLFEMYRGILLNGEFPRSSSLLYTGILACILIFGSFWLMRRVDRLMPKLLTQD
jgi:ABC-type polysaccharide/polyol phosphate export permease